MKARIIAKCSMMVLMLMAFIQLTGQISPGELSEPHSGLEGMSNCTQCHTLGSKVSNDKCLACHTEIKERTDVGKGYHSSSEVSGKSCVICHNDHHGKSFDIIRFVTANFDHRLAGYELTGAHAKKSCDDCHKSEFIKDQKIKKKKYHSYLGLDTECLSCHQDYHQNSLSRSCTNCHSLEAFKPASKFDHNTAKFKLLGKHQAVSCIQCHKMETLNGRQVQKFTGLQYSSCLNCHKDIHNNKFGPDCRQCHNEESFHQVQGMEGFDHNKTGFILENKHQSVKCNLCHKSAFTVPVKHERCSDCHIDYHENQFAKNGVSPDCSACHSTNGFSYFSYTFEQHSQSRFPLDGAHIAIPCFECHKKSEKWSFRNIGIRCSECHHDIHDPYLDKKYYPYSECKKCHNTISWHEISFNHDTTGFVLGGKHKTQSCRACHFYQDDEGNVRQNFSSNSGECKLCHKDIHYNQFALEGVTDCSRCHEFENWKASRFDHNKARFILDGKHSNVACNKCHKTIQNGDTTYIQYILNEFKCESCHH